jgi:hypothetical protein
VRLRSAEQRRTGKSPRRPAALLGIFAILLQAILFAWHHHPSPLSSRVPVIAAAGGHETPASEDDECQICFALSYHSIAPIDFVVVPPRTDVSLPAPTVQAVSAPVAPYLLFRSRAPPAT